MTIIHYQLSILNCKTVQIIQSIQNRIYEIRGHRVMLDFDLALLYETETKSLKRAVKRNIARFPEDFMFELTASEWQSLRYQIGTSKIQGIESQGNTLVAIISEQRGGNRYLPYAFTEQGVAMLSGVLHSDKAIQMNIAIMRAFVELRRVLLTYSDMKAQLQAIREHLDSHDAQLNGLYDSIENLLDEKAAQRKWDDRERIGFKAKDTKNE